MPDTLTPEQLADIRKHHEIDGVTLADENAPFTVEALRELAKAMKRAHTDRAALLSHIEAQAWRPIPTNARKIVEHHLEQIEGQCAEADACGHDDFAEHAALAAKWLRDILPPAPAKDPAP